VRIGHRRIGRTFELLKRLTLKSKVRKVD